MYFLRNVISKIQLKFEHYYLFPIHFWLHCTLKVLVIPRNFHKSHKNGQNNSHFGHAMTSHAFFPSPNFPVSTFFCVCWELLVGLHHWWPCFQFPLLLSCLHCTRIHHYHHLHIRLHFEAQVVNKSLPIFGRRKNDYCHTAHNLKFFPLIHKSANGKSFSSATKKRTRQKILSAKVGRFDAMRAKLFSEELELDTAETKVGQNWTWPKTLNAKWYKVCHGGGFGLVDGKINKSRNNTRNFLLAPPCHRAFSFGFVSFCLLHNFFSKIYMYMPTYIHILFLAFPSLCGNSTALFPMLDVEKFLI